MNEGDPLKFIRVRLNVLTPETPQQEVRDALENLIPLLARLEEVKFESFWAELAEHLTLKGRFFTALRRKVGEIRKELNRSAPVQGKDLNSSPEDELKILRPIAAPLAKCPDHLGMVAEALRLCGLAGQVREAKIIYLAVTSRVLNVKVLVNVAVKGPSSGGKSFLVEVVLEFFPLSAFYALTAMSEKALAYSEESLSHRFLIIYEAAGLGSEFGQYLIRSLLSEGRVIYETVEKIGGRLTPRRIEKEGPTGFITTTTKAGLHPENETRLLSLEVDDTPEQTMEVLKAHAEGENPKSGSQNPIDLAPFKALQRILELENRQAVVPFAMALAQGCSPTAVRLRRDFPAVLNLVKAHTILHAHLREKDEHGRVIATVEDYAVVYDLVSDLVCYGTGHKVSEKVRETVEAVKHLVAKSPSGVTYRVIGIKLGIDESAARRRVQTAISKGYLQNQETKPSCAAKIVLGEPLPDAKEVLPHPNALNGGPTESTTDQPTNDDSLVKPNSYGRQPKEPTDCQQPTDAPQDSRTVETEGGQAVGRESVNKCADHNCMKSQDLQSQSADRHEQPAETEEDIFRRGEGVGEEDLESCKADLVQCGNCQHFSPSLDAPSGRGSCLFYAGSWNGKSTQFSGDLHPCLSFNVKDSIKVLAAWDEAISHKVGEVVEALKLGNNPDLMEVLV